MKFKENWSFADSKLVDKGKDNMTEYGLSSYWDAVDSTFKFNTQHHDLFVAKSLCSASKVNTSNEACKEDTSGVAKISVNRHPNEMQQFFKHHRCDRRTLDRYHWHSYDAREDIARRQKTNNRFLLPRLSNRH